MKLEPSLLARGLLLLLAARCPAGCTAVGGPSRAERPRQHVQPSEQSEHEPQHDPTGLELTLGIGAGRAQDGDAVLGSVGVLAPVAEHLALGGRFAAYDFEMSESGSLSFDGRSFDASQTTSGSGLGLGGELRYYVARDFEGFWLGGGALYFPIRDSESTGTAREPVSGLAFVSELEPEEVDFVPYGAIGWTFRGMGRTSWTLELDAGSAAGELFAVLTLRIGYGI